jgi:hypothetical protein
MDGSPCRSEGQKQEEILAGKNTSESVIYRGAWVVTPIEPEYTVENLNGGGSAKQTHRWMVVHAGVRNTLGIPK